ncbi:hypothetical protein KM043_010991 [Ampulex compressa]|nr:hypothetical protein KM043_010991 [Ampulex compressa]
MINGPSQPAPVLADPANPLANPTVRSEIPIGRLPRGRLLRPRNLLIASDCPVSVANCESGAISLKLRASVVHGITWPRCATQLQLSRALQLRNDNFGMAFTIIAPTVLDGECLRARIPGTEEAPRL